MQSFCDPSLKVAEYDAISDDMRTAMMTKAINEKINNKNIATAMAKVCQITGKKAQVGNNVSHSKRRTKRKFEVNLHTKKYYWVEQDMWIVLRVSAHAMRTINKIGLNAALKKAEAAGNIDFKDIKILSL